MDHMKSFQIIAQTLPGVPDPSIAIAACRAGELGILDLQYTTNEDAALKSIRKLAQFAHNDFGIKLGRHNINLPDKIESDILEKLKVVILVWPDIKNRKTIVQAMTHAS